MAITNCLSLRSVCDTKAMALPQGSASKSRGMSRGIFCAQRECVRGAHPLSARGPASEQIDFCEQRLLVNDLRAEKRAVQWVRHG